MANRKQRILDRLHETAPPAVDEALYAQLRQEFAEVSERTLRETLRHSGLPLAPLVEGVNQETLESLERTLDVLSTEYQNGDAARKRLIREMVITSKDHARLAASGSRVSEEKKAEKSEMLLWLQTWLENPGLFAKWVELRRRALAVTEAPDPQ